MKRGMLFLSTLVSALLLAAGAGLAATPETVQTQEQVYGSQLMTQPERMEYRNKMRAAKTYQEREQIRNEHHEQMKVRAKAHGVTLPDEPPTRGGGMGPGGGRGR
jgi:hypothetical protein